MKFGLHTRPQFVSMAALESVWERVEDAGFDWISVSDRLYAHPDPEKTERCFEAVATWSNLAARTKRVRVGCLLVNALLQTPLQIARAAATIDHISRGRADLGLGAGYVEADFIDQGVSYPKTSTRLAALAEVVPVVKALHAGERVTFRGEYTTVEDAVCSVVPVQPAIPIWMGGHGTRITPRLVAHHAHGAAWAFLSPGQVDRQNRAVDEACEGIGRDPTEIPRSVNLSAYFGKDQAAANQRAAAFDKLELRKEGALLGTPNQVVDTLRHYEEVGVTQVNVTFRQEFDDRALDCLASDVMPHFIN